MSGHSAYLGAQSKEKGEYLDDSHLLKGLKTFGLTYKELLDANLKNINMNAYKEVPKRYKTEEEFIKRVEEKLSSQATKSLRSIVSVIKHRTYGINPHIPKERNKSVPVGQKHLNKHQSSDMQSHNASETSYRHHGMEATASFN